MAELVLARRGWGLVISCALLLASLSSTWSREARADEVAGAPSEAALAEARLHFENGVSLLQASPPNYQDAHRQFLLAYEKSGKRWSILGNLALCALNLERDGEALAAYQEYLARGGDEIDPNERASIEREVLLIKGNLATVHLTSVAAGTKVTVSREGSSAPVQAYVIGREGTKLGLRAGQIEITATSGDKSETWSVVLSAGDEKTHAFRFAPEAPIATSVAAQPVEPTRSSSPLRTVGWVTTGVGVVGLLGGVAAGVATLELEKQARSQCTSGGVCPESAEQAFDTAQDLALLTNVLFIAGGVVTATGVTLVILGSGSKERAPETASIAHSTLRERAPRLALEPRVGAGFLGLSAKGHF